MNFYLTSYSFKFTAQETGGVLGPTKIYLAVQPATNAQPPPLAPVQLKPDIGSNTQVSIY